MGSPGQQGKAVASRTCCGQPPWAAEGEPQQPRTATCTQRHRCAEQRTRLGLPAQTRRASASSLPPSTDPDRSLAPRRDPTTPRSVLGRPLRARADASGRSAHALPTPCGDGAQTGWRRGGAAHARPLPAVTEGRRAPAAAMARRVVRGLLLLEAAGLLGALLLYRAMDRSQDFRHTMQKRFPSILEVYYKSNEWSGIHGIRENDQMTWLSSKN
ncbi:protein CEBPZOS [Rissa tridactyla]|uniref:protein CEBPZOS n=1 Tax=Rissa tridactyla TaxID=75485 RepID=UPI0023BAF918|nr:protein CEBPZOS [Rissa tridactyla]